MEPNPTRRGPSLATQILLGLLVGAALAVALNLLYAPAAGAEASAAWDRVQWCAKYLAKPVGDVFLRMLFMVVVPLVFCSLVLGVAGLSGNHGLGRVGLRTMAWFVGTTTLAVCVGLLLVNVFAPGHHIDATMAAQLKADYASKASERIEQAAQGTGFSIYTFVNIVPRNVVASAGNEREALGVIFFALLVGMAVSRIGAERTRVFREFVQTLYDVCVKLLGYAMKIAPLGVAGLIFDTTVRMGFDVLVSLLYYVAVAVGGLILYQLVVITTLARVMGGVGPAAFYRGTRTLLVTAFSTSSSNATLPTTIRTAVENFGVPRPVAGFVMPLGATMNMNGTALFEGVTVLFLAQVAGVQLGLLEQAVVVVLAVLTAIGTAGVPGGSLPLLTIVLAQVGVPPDMIGLILGVDRIVDMTRTIPNVTSDLVCSIWIGRTEGPRLAAAGALQPEQDTSSTSST